MKIIKQVISLHGWFEFYGTGPALCATVLCDNDRKLLVTIFLTQEIVDDLPKEKIFKMFEQAILEEAIEAQNNPKTPELGFDAD